MKRHEVANDFFFGGGNFPGRCRLGMNKSQVPQDSEEFFFFFFVKCLQRWL